VRLLRGAEMKTVARTGKPMLGVAVSHDGQRVAVVGFGKFALSKDGGNTFDVVDSPGLATFYAAAFAQERLFVFDDRGHGYVRVGEGPFAPLALPRRATFFTAAFAGERFGYVVGSCGVLLETTDGGDTWKVRPSPSNELQGVVATGRALYLAALDGVFRSIDRGEVWEKVFSPRYGCTRLAEHQGSLAVTCNDVGQPLWLARPGEQFQKVELDHVVQALLAAAFDSNGELVAVGPNDLVVRASGAAGVVAYDSPATRRGLAQAAWLFNELRKERRQRPENRVPIAAQKPARQATRPAIGRATSR